MRIAIAVIGALLTVWLLMAVAQVMLVPRPASSWLPRLIARTLFLLAVLPARLSRNYSRQDRWLAGTGPLVVLLELVVYVALLIAALGLFVYGTSDLDWLEAFYQSGSTLTTLGIVAPVNVPSAIVTFIAALIGLVVIALFIGYLMALYSAYVSRESVMARLSMLAGEPAWGPVVLFRASRLGIAGTQAPQTMDWINWTCDLRLNHQVNPVLASLRSTSPNRHWSVTLLAVLDATALRIATDAEKPRSDWVQLITEGAITLTTLNLNREGAARLHNWTAEHGILDALAATEPVPFEDAGLSEEEWQHGYKLVEDSLRVDGVQPLPDPDVVWRRFAHLRRMYFRASYDIAARYFAVPAPWSGPRNPAMPLMEPETALESA